MKTLLFFLGATMVTLLLPYLLDTVTVYLHVGGVEVPLGTLLVFLGVFLPLVVWAAWSLTHPLTRGSVHAASAERAARHLEYAARTRTGYPDRKQVAMSSVELEGAEAPPS